MKKLLVLCISFVLLFSFISCNNDVAKPNEPDQGGQTDKPSLDVPSDFKPSDDNVISAPNEDDLKAINNIIAEVQKINLENSQSLITEVFTAALQNGVTLNLPNSDSGDNIISLKANGAFTEENKLGLTANLEVNNYSIVAEVPTDPSDHTKTTTMSVSATGKLVATVVINLADLITPSQSRGSGVSDLFDVIIEEGSDLKITLGIGSVTSEYQIGKFIEECSKENSTIPMTVMGVVMSNYKQVANDALTIFKDFFERGYKLETEHFTVSVTGKLSWALSDVVNNIGSRDGSEESGSSDGKSEISFGTFFKSISMTDLEIQVYTNKEVTLNDSGYQLKLVAKVNEAKMEPAKEKYYDYNEEGVKVLYETPDGIKFSINADADLSILTTGKIGVNAIYAKGHFDGVTGMVGEVEGQGMNPSAYLRFNGTDYNAINLVKNIIASMKPAQSK